MPYFSEAFLGHRRRQWLRSIYAVEVQVGAAWHRGSIDQKTVEGDTLVIMATFPTLDDRAATITASRIIDIRGEQAAYQQREIKKVAGQGTLVKISVPIYEVAE